MAGNLQNVPGQTIKAIQDGNFTPVWYRWLVSVMEYINNSGGTGGAQPAFNGFSGTVVLAKITALGSNGSLTVLNGIITAYTAPT